MGTVKASISKEFSLCFIASRSMTCYCRQMPKKSLLSLTAILIAALACGPGTGQLTPTLSSAPLPTRTSSPQTVEATQPTEHASQSDTQTDTTWAAALRVESSDPTRVGENTYHSSSRLATTWIHAPQPVDHYEITANDNVTFTDVVFSIDASASSEILTEVKSGTQYAAIIRACLDTSCNAFLEGDSSASATTAEETWQIQGEGNSYETALQIVPDGTTAPYVFRYGEAAGTDLAGVFHIYYNSQANSPWGRAFGAGTTKRRTQTRNLLLLSPSPKTASSAAIQCGTAAAVRRAHCA